MPTTPENRMTMLSKPPDVTRKDHRARFTPTQSYASCKRRLLDMFPEGMVENSADKNYKD
jgi:hypothetical protein